MEQEPAKPQDGEKAEHPPLRHRRHSGWLGMAIFLCLLGFASFALPEPSFSITMPLLLLALLCALLALFTRPPAPNAASSSGGWLGLAVVLFVLGLVVCGSGSAAMLFLAALFALPAVLGRRRPGQRFGMILMIVSLSVGMSLYSKQGWHPRPYSDYLRRAKAAEALNLLGKLKPQVEQWHKDKKRCPGTLELGVQIQSKYTERIALTRADTAKCVYTATLKTDAGFSKNAIIGLAYLIEQQTWSCTDADTGTTKLELAYLPHACRKED
ncbi:MAG: hypothetical protein GY862_28235 [Gammaproteobacteria bacterium]|nr:hypothetical protein [Gammaproteobacteria bacterium]